VSRRFALGIVLGGLITGALVLFVALPIALTHRTDLPGERGYAALVVSLVARVAAGNATNPLANDPRALDAGREAYTGSCAVCHGAKGDGRGAFGPATYPDATDLTLAVTKEKTDAELFWIIKNGLSFTAMPGFGDVYKEQDIWSLVSYVRALGRGGTAAIDVRAATASDLALADPKGDAVARGAAIYFAQGCALCHAANGEAPGSLFIRGRIETEIVRRGERGMPAYGKDQISDAELKDLEAYLLRFAAVPSSPD
jgi:mono/diheme cytochrome c family protein